MRPIVYHADINSEPQLVTEMQAIEACFDTVTDLHRIGSGRLVLGRFSMLPFYEARQQEIEAQGSCLLVDVEQYDYLSRVERWYPDLQQFTPATAFSLADVRGSGPFFVKGQINSRKHDWATHAYAADRAALEAVCERLASDPLLGSQGLCVRDYVPLAPVAAPLASGMPRGEEYRFFVLDGEVVCGGRYWTGLGARPDYDPDSVPRRWLDEAISHLRSDVRLLALDVARAADGRWLVIECNDAAHSGLGEIAPTALWGGLAARLT